MQQPPPDPVDEWPERPGFEVVWRVDDRSALLVEGDRTKCRRPGCVRPACWELRRSNGWWSYCDWHTYGREIRDDGVYMRRFEEVA